MLGRLHGIIVLLALLAVCCNGCSKSDKQLTNRVNVKVLLDSKPLAEARVLFLPKRLSKDRRIVPVASVQTDESGAGDVLTDTGSDQLPLGVYTVLISKPCDARLDYLQTQLGGPMIGPDLKMLFSNRTDDLPPIYNRQTTLEFEVVAGEKCHVVFELRTD